MAKDIANFQATKLPAELSFGVLTSDDIENIATHEEALRKVDYADRVANGDICYGLKRDEELLSYNWIRFNECCVFCSFPWEIGFLPLSDQQAFTYDFYTYTAHRKHGYGSLLKMHLLADLSSKGIHEIYSIVYRHNFASLSIHLRLNYEAKYLFNGYQLLDYSWYRLVAAKELPGLADWIDQFRQSRQIGKGV